MSLLPSATFISPNETFYASEAGAGSQTLSQSGNTVSLAPGGSSVNIATTTLVAGTAVKTTAMSYDGGILSTTFAGNVIVTNDLEVGTPADPGRVFVDGTVEPTTITDSAGLVGTAGQVLSAGVAGGSLLWTAGGGGGGSGTVTSVAVGANGLVLSGTPTIAPIISLPTATATVGQYLVSDATGTFIVGGANVRIGNNASTTGSSVALGASALCSVTNAVAIGPSAQAQLANGIAVGSQARAVGANGVAVGAGCFATGQHSTTIGQGSDGNGEFSISLGSGTVTNNIYSMAVGRQASTSHNGAIVLNGSGATLGSSASSLHVKPVIAKTTETDVLYYDSASGLVSYGAGGGGGGLPATTTAGEYLVSDGSAYVTAGANVRLGNNASASANSVSIGQNCISQNLDVAIGAGATCPANGGDSRIAIGRSITVAGDKGIGMGFSSACDGGASVAIGLTASSAGLNSIAIGNSAVSAGEGCVSYGNGAQTNLLHDIAIGSGAVCPPNIGPPLPVPQAGINRIAIGNGAIAYGENCISIGHTISNTVPNAIVIGNTVDSVFLESLYVKPIALNQDSTNILYYNESNGLVTYGAGGGGGGGVTSITAGSNISVDSTIPSAPVVAVSISADLDMASQNLTNALNVGCVTATVGQALNYADSGSVICADTKAGFYQGLLCQNKSSTDHASANVVCVNDSLGSDYSALGINSSVFGNLYNTVFEIPNATYASGTADTVIGSQSDHVVSGNHSLYLAYNSGEGAFCINTQGALSMNASNPSGVLNKGDFGTVGQLLSSAGSGAPPTWEDPPALLTILGATVGDAPLNTTVPATWMSVTVNGGSYRIPLYQ